MPKFIVEVEEGMDLLEFSEETEKLELVLENAYETVIHEALQNYGFDSISVTKIEE